MVFRHASFSMLLIFKVRVLEHTNSQQTILYVTELFGQYSDVFSLPEFLIQAKLISTSIFREFFTWCRQNDAVKYFATMC